MSGHYFKVKVGILQAKGRNASGRVSMVQSCGVAVLRSDNDRLKVRLCSLSHMPGLCPIGNEESLVS